MAIRLERSGELMLIRGTADEPDEPRNSNKWVQLGLWLVLVALTTGVLFVGPHPLLEWAAVSHAFEYLMAASW